MLGFSLFVPGLTSAACPKGLRSTGRQASRDFDFSVDDGTGAQADKWKLSISLLYTQSPIISAIFAAFSTKDSAMVKQISRPCLANLPKARRNLKDNQDHLRRPPEAPGRYQVLVSN